MKIGRRPIIRAISLIMLLFLWVELIFAADTKVPTSGKDIYAKKCATCHGPKGEGVAKMEKMLKAKIRNFGETPAPPETLAVWKKITMDGKGKMPSYKAKLNAAETDSVLAYVHSLTKLREPAQEAKPDSTKVAGKK